MAQEILLLAQAPVPAGGSAPSWTLAGEQWPQAGGMPLTAQMGAWRIPIPEGGNANATAAAFVGQFVAPNGISVWVVDLSASPITCELFTLAQSWSQVTLT